MIEIDQFITYIEQNEDLAPGTVINCRANMRLFSQWLQAKSLTIATVTHADMKAYRDELKTRYKPNTINRKLSYASKFFSWCVQTGIASFNPLQNVKHVKSQEYPRWLSQEQVEQLLEAAQRHIDHAKSHDLDFTVMVALKVQTIFVVLLNTGLRVSELCELKLSDIKNGVITVRWGKGSKRRQVPVNAQAKSALDCWLQVRQSKTDFVFVARGGKMGRRLVNWHIGELGKATGINLTPHMLRHTFGKMLADKGIALDRIAKLMGHSNINTTAIYTMPSLEDLRRDIETLI